MLMIEMTVIGVMITIAMIAVTSLEWKSKSNERATMQSAGGDKHKIKLLESPSLFVRPLVRPSGNFSRIIDLCIIHTCIHPHQRHVHHTNVRHTHMHQSQG